MANDFSGDTDAVALFDMESGALTTDSIGTNTLTDNNTVGNETTNMKVGDGCGDYEDQNNEYLSITDANLDSDFPLKSGNSSTFSIAFWYKPESSNAGRGLVTKNDNTSQVQLLFRDSNGTIEYWIGYSTSYEVLDDTYTSITAGRWYHIAITFDNSSKEWKLRIWDDTSGTVVHNVSGTATNNMNTTKTAPFIIGTWLNGGSPWANTADGLIDEVVVFKDILTTGEIDQIRQGTYSVAGSGLVNNIDSHLLNSFNIRGLI